ncbi:hypothetical protein OG948_60340 (plasmid) [Embleya sp. NBC_00888]|uniref:hypothetical protein n=1 Tax=Embleya sp. NBC_00888 TaxID=2975960 RepID=UPI003863FE1B|nr:hypothetical protein OG948_60340 [Embleya sp. NBC_00888]
MRISDSAAHATLRAAGLEATGPYPGYALPWPSHCTRCGTTTSPTLANLRKGQGGCRVCAAATSARRRTVPAHDAESAMRAAGLIPQEPYRNARAPWSSRCAVCGAATAPTLDAVRRKRGFGCRSCANASAGRERIRAAAELAVDEFRAVGLEPLEDFPGVTARWRALCTGCGAVVHPNLNSVRTGNSGGCRHCGMRAMGEAKLARHAARALADMRAALLEPLTPYPGAVTPWPARCGRCAARVAPRLHDVRAGQSGCRTCAHTAASTRRLAAGTARALADLDAAGLVPLEPYPGSGAPWSSRCRTCERVVSPCLVNIRSGCSGCRHCAHLASGRTRIDRKAAPAVAAMLDADLEPLEPYPGRAKPWRCLCRGCGAQSSPMLSTILSGSRCRWCATWGFAPAAPALVYVLHHHDWGAAKIGVTGLATVSDRIRSLGRGGWALEHTTPFEIGADALATEQSVLAYLRASGHRPFVARDRMPYGGHTETFDARSVHVGILVSLIAEHTPRSV